MSEKPYLVTRSLSPENQESPIHFIDRHITPEEYFYIRNHFEYPKWSDELYQLSIIGEVQQSLTFSYKDILMNSNKSIHVVLECAGNKRRYFEPKVYGEAWEDGAISHGVVSGISLRDILKLTGIKDDAKEVIFEGADYGKRTDLKGEYHYARSLPLEKALYDDVIIATKLNNKPLSYKHGYPMRLIVPGYYAMASVKWLRRIIVTKERFKGPFQEIDYNYYPYKESDLEKIPVTTINVNSIIQQPLDYSKLSTGYHLIYGLAWTGEGNIIHVEISFDGGKTWEKANLIQDQLQPYSWVKWYYRWKVDKKGEYRILSKASDSHSRVQPEQPMWNRKGYGYNSFYTIHVKVE